MNAAELRVLQRRGAIALTAREVRRVVGLWTQTILPPVITALLFLAVFGGALGGRIHRIEGIQYLDFILPGLLVMTIAGQATANAATSLFQAKNEGYIEDILTSPLRPWQIVASYAAGSLARAYSAASSSSAGINVSGTKRPPNAPKWPSASGRTVVALVIMSAL